MCAASKAPACYTAGTWRADLAVVIRSAGERTAGVCRAIAERQVGSSNLAVIEERPFEQALRRCYELGMESGCKWLLTLDADVLLRSGAVADIMEEAERASDNVFQLKPLVYDKFSLSYRQAGLRLYRTALLHRACHLIPAPGEKIRPETEVGVRMRAEGGERLDLTVCGGLHDHEQYYRDIYRKCFVHGRKHVQEMSSVFHRWQAAGAADPDYRIAMHGFSAGALFKGKVCIDKLLFMEEVNDILAREKLDEKPPLSVDGTGEALVDSISRTSRKSR